MIIALAPKSEKTARMKCIIQSGPHPTPPSPSPFSWEEKGEGGTD